MKEFVRKLPGGQHEQEEISNPVAGHRIYIPADAVINIAHERGEHGELESAYGRWIRTQHRRDDHRGNEFTDQLS
jgi:hypothetical protein